MNLTLHSDLNKAHKKIKKELKEGKENTNMKQIHKHLGSYNVSNCITITHVDIFESF